VVFPTLGQIFRATALFLAVPTGENTSVASISSNLYILAKFLAHFQLSAVICMGSNIQKDQLIKEVNDGHKGLYGRRPQFY
jgi:hypothetical protein